MGSDRRKGGTNRQYIMSTYLKMSRYFTCAFTMNQVRSDQAFKLGREFKGHLMLNAWRSPQIIPYHFSILTSHLALAFLYVVSDIFSVSVVSAFPSHEEYIVLMLLLQGLGFNTLPPLWNMCLIGFFKF